MSKATIEYLKAKVESGKTSEEALHDLSEELSIKLNFLDDLVLLKYDQVFSPKTHPIVMECRSLVLESTYPFNLVSKKFDRFFNLGECPDFEKDIDLLNCRVFEKADGSLMGVFKHKGKVYLTTSGTLDSSASYSSNKSFREMALEAAGFKSEEEFQWFFDFLETGETLVFELIHVENRIVTPYEKNEWVLLSFNQNGAELSYKFLVAEAKIMNRYGLSVRPVKVYDSVAHVMQLEHLMRENLSGLDEGFVILDTVTKKRLKLKREEYVAAHRLRGENREPSNKDLLNLILTNEMDEFLQYFPRYKERVDAMNEKLEFTLWHLDEKAKSCGYLDDSLTQKEYALSVRDSLFQNLLFQARKHKALPSVVFNKMVSEEKFRQIRKLFDIE